MAFTVYQTNKKTGAVYAYLQEAYRDPETGRPKSKRTYLGRVDPVTKQLIEKADDGKRNRSKLGSEILEENNELPEEVSALIEQQKQLIQEYQSQISELTKKNEKLLHTLKSISEVALTAVE